MPQTTLTLGMKDLLPFLHDDEITREVISQSKEWVEKSGIQIPNLDAYNRIRETNETTVDFDMSGNITYNWSFNDQSDVEINYLMLLVLINSQIIKKHIQETSCNLPLIDFLLTGESMNLSSIPYQDLYYITVMVIPAFEVSWKTMKSTTESILQNLAQKKMIDNVIEKYEKGHPESKTFELIRNFCLANMSSKKALIHKIKTTTLNNQLKQDIYEKLIMSQLHQGE